MPAISKTQRQLDLIAYLLGRRLPTSFEELITHVPAYAEKWDDADDTARESVRRTFERDKDDLRALGIPLETVKYRINYGAEEAEGYRIARRDFYLPYLKLVEHAGPDAPRGDVARIETLLLEPEQASAAGDALHRVAELPAFPFAEEARSALRKLAFDLGPELLGGAPTLYLDPPGGADPRDVLARLRDALLARKRVGFRYHGAYRGEPTDRDVAPYGLLFHGAHWYLVGSDAARDGDVRVFRVGRMEDVRPNASRPNTPDYDVPPDFDLDAYIGREAWELGEDAAPVEASVTFRFPTSLRAERNAWGTLVEPGPDGAATRAFRVHQADPFLRWLLSLQGEAVVESPAELADALRTLARAVARMYEPGS
ncbi:MAG: helix-turn-helix transcriptional regulator [Longimicrobiales bacterium]